MNILNNLNQPRSFTTSALLYKIGKGLTQSQWRPQLPQSALENAGKEISSGVMPHKLMLVYKITPMYNLPHYEKSVLKEVGLGKNIRNYHRIVVKNTPLMCKLLWQVKHLIRVVPLKFPCGVPSSEDEILNTKIKEDGTVLIIKKIKSPNDNSVSKNSTDALIPPIPEKYKDVYMSGFDCKRYHQNIWI